MKTAVELRQISGAYLANLEEIIAKSAFDLQGYIRSIAKSQARKNHIAWCEEKRANGYVYGEVVDDEAKTTNLLVDFDELPEEYKVSNINNAATTVELMMTFGVFAGYPLDDEDKEAMILAMAESIHDKWCLTKKQQGYVYGEKRNDDPTKGEKTHRDMLPFSTLMEVYPEDISYDCKTARGIIDAMVSKGMMLVKAA